MRKRIIGLATGFGLGYSPVAPGTVGTLLGLIPAALIARLGWPWQAVAAAVLTLAAIPICDAAEDSFGHKDDRRIVADEYLTFPIVLIGIPWMHHVWLLPVAFVLNRVLDIVKPPPARQAQIFQGGLGIVLDDMFSCLYTLGLMHLLVHFAVR